MKSRKAARPQGQPGRRHAISNVIALLSRPRGDDCGSHETERVAAALGAWLRPIFMLTPTNAFATPVLGGQASVGMTALYGKNATSVFATLSGPDMETQSGGRADHVAGFGDLYPSASLRRMRYGY
jgi:hypothetical protein